LAPAVLEAPFVESINIRPAEIADIPAIFHVRTSVVVNLMTETELATIGITRQSIESMLEAGEARAWCAEVENEVVGFSLAFRSERELAALFVLPRYEKRGFGSALLDQAVNWLESHGREPIRLVTDRETPAYRFYKTRGWVDLGYGPEDEVLEGDIYMEYNSKV
jgi:GNAT superfamily N-acetyltransferase